MQIWYGKGGEPVILCPDCHVARVINFAAGMTAHVLAQGRGDG